MKYITLNNGVKMPLVGLGTWNLKNDECIHIVEKAINLGYRMIDTAQMYGNEVEVGKGIANSGVERNELFITTKLHQISNSYEKAKSAIDISLNNLGLDYIDLLLLHEPYLQGPSMYLALEEAYQSRKVRAIGISNYDEKNYTAFLEKCKIVPAINQLEVHVYYQKSVFQRYLESKGTYMQAWAPLVQGINHVAKHPLLLKIGNTHGKSAAQIALRFLVQRGISVIPKSRNEARLAENIDIFDFTLSREEMRLIETLDRDDTLFLWTKNF